MKSHNVLAFFAITMAIATLGFAVSGIFLKPHLKDPVGRTYYVKQDGYAMEGLTLEAELSSRAIFRDSSGRRIVYYGTFKYQEMSKK